MMVWNQIESWFLYLIASLVFRTQSTKHNKITDVGTPETIEKEEKSNDVNYNNELQEKIIISVGFNLIKVVKRMDKAFASMIVTTYFICMLVATGALYLSSSVLFSRGECEVTLLSAAGLSITWLAIFRVYQMTKYGCSLAKKMKKCSYQLDRFQFSDPNNLENGSVQLLREEFQNNHEAPIAPYSAFTLSSSSLLSLFGTIVTYIIVLLQFKTS